MSDGRNNGLVAVGVAVLSAVAGWAFAKWSERKDESAPVCDKCQSSMHCCQCHYCVRCNPTKWHKEQCEVCKEEGQCDNFIPDSKPRNPEMWSELKEVPPVKKKVSKKVIKPTTKKKVAKKKASKKKATKKNTTPKKVTSK
jgi:hypothetical protein